MSTVTMTTATKAAMTGRRSTSPVLRFEAGSIVGLLDWPVHLQELIATLIGTGIKRESIQVITSSALEQESLGTVGRLGSVLGWLGPERRLAEHYRAGLAGGSVLVAIRNLNGHERDRIAVALKSSGGYFVHGFGRFTIRRMAV